MRSVQDGGGVEMRFHMLGEAMADEAKNTHVTRAEFYTMVGGIYSLIALALVGVLRHEESVLAVIGYSLITLSALVMCFSFSIFGIRERRKQKREAGADRPPG